MGTSANGAYLLIVYNILIFCLIYLVLYPAVYTLYVEVLIM